MRGLLLAMALASGTSLRPGHPDVDPSRVPLGTVGFASVRVTADESAPLNTSQQTITPLRWNGVDALRVASVHASASGDTTYGEIIVRATDLSLLHHRVRAARDSMSASSSGGYVTGWVALPGQPVRLFDVPVEGPVFPVDGATPWLISALPLSEGYRASIARFDPWTGEVKDFVVEVLASEVVEIDGEAVTCWKVDTGPMGPPGYRGIRWVHPSSGLVLQSVLQGPEEGPTYRSRMVSFEPWERRDPPVTIEDVRILERAQEILATPAAWDREDDRQCEENDTTYSLFCALQRASMEVLGEYQHRRAALQEVRFAIEQVSGGREFEHRLMDFNNTASFEEVQAVLRLALEQVERRLAESTGD